MAKNLLKLLSTNKALFVLIVLGSLVWSMTMLRSGLCWDAMCEGGLGFWGPNGHDGVWHIALAESLKSGSLEAPIFAGERISNYHLGFDFALALLSKATAIPVSTFYFQLLPVALAISIGIAGYLLVYAWSKSKLAALFSTFFIYFGGSWGWVVNLARGNGISGESMFWAQQSISTLLNPPFALSVLFLFVGLGLIQKYKVTSGQRYLWLAIILFGVLFQIKAYAAVLVLAALFASAVFDYFVNRKKELLYVLLGSGLINFILYLAFAAGSHSLLLVHPFWFIESMMDLTDRLGWRRYWEAMTSYRSGGNTLRYIVSYTAAFAIFILGNMGTRALGLLAISKKAWSLKQATWLDVFSATIIAAGLLLPLVFVQAGTPWNTIQFTYYSLFFMSLFAGLAMATVYKYSNLGKAAVVLIMALTVPTAAGTLRDYTTVQPAAILPLQEMEALAHLRALPPGVVLAYPFDQKKAQEAPRDMPRPLYLYESTAYVSAYSAKPVYLENQVNLVIMGYSWEERREAIEAFYQTLDQAEAREFLAEHKISYLYWVSGQRAKLGEDQLGIELVFENEGAKVYKVLK